jgi:hypothetical protein
MNQDNRYRLLIKFMDEKYVDGFMNEGLLYMNNIKYFREYEDNDPALRGDTHEGLEASWLPEKITININGRTMKDLSGKVDVRQIHQDNTNIYCMTIISDHAILSQGEGGLYLSEDFLKFGNKAICIAGSNIGEFWNRVEEAMATDESIYTLNKDNIVYGKINYIDRATHHESLTVFSKFLPYEWQHEWRIAFNKDDHVGKYEFRIGSLADIAFVVNATELVNKPIQLRRDVL